MALMEFLKKHETIEKIRFFWVPPILEAAIRNSLRKILRHLVILTNLSPLACRKELFFYLPLFTILSSELSAIHTFRCLLGIEI